MSILKKTVLLTAAVAIIGALADRPAAACTNYLVSKGASADGSTMITYAADAHVLYGELYFTPAAVHPPGAMLDVYEWDTGDYLGQIEQAPVTYTVVGNMNEHQVSIGETTWGGRPELHDPDAVIDYGSLMYITLQRARTAREAIQIMTDLVAEYGYYSSGEAFSIADPDEVWIMDLIGKGPDNKGAVWVARRVPDGYISGHANAARIRRFPLDDENTLYAPDVITFAREMGWYDGPDAEFSFADTYSPPDFGAQRFCDARVWCMFNRAAPSLGLPPDWALGEEGADPYPLWIKPDRKLTVADVMGYMRDHFEGTPLDMTQDIGAGPYQLPYRWRPLTWKIEDDSDTRYFNERAVSTQQTGFSFVAQARSWLPNPIGGILWFGVDDTYSTVYFPMYCGATRVPESFAVGTGDFHNVTWDSAFWVFNLVANFAYQRYSEMIVDIQKVQAELETGFFAEVPQIDEAAVELFERSPRLARDYLTDYSVARGDMVVDRWRELSKFLLYRYLDGNLKNEHGEVKHPGYPEEWYRMVAEATGDRLQLQVFESERLAEAERQRELKQLTESVLALLQARGFEIDAATREMVYACEDMKQAKAWLVSAAIAESVEEVFTETSAGH
jgi:dipeptidase